MSGAELMILGKLLLTFGVLLGLPLWELYRLGRERRRREAVSGASADAGRAQAASSSVRGS
ncbi:MAG: hypothetical protein P8172_03395 [Gammaproteobacteria bacterium]|jgi:hypothetical protein